MIPIQYQRSPVITALADFVYQHFDSQRIVDDFYNLVFNLETANGYGLDIWGKIVGASRFVSLKNLEVKYFGFDGTPNYSFNQGIFYTGGIQGYDRYKLADGSYRTLILLKALINIADMTNPMINQLLQSLASNTGRNYVIDMGDAGIEYHFDIQLNPVDLALLSGSIYQPKPAGVKVNRIIQFDPKKVLMFAEAGGVNSFNQAPFFSSENVIDG